MIIAVDGPTASGKGTLASALDYRIAMIFAVAGQHCYQAVTVDDVSPIATIFPTFEAMLAGLSVS